MSALPQLTNAEPLPASRSPLRSAHYYARYSERAECWLLQKQLSDGTWSELGDYGRLQTIIGIAEDENAILDLEDGDGFVERVCEPDGEIAA